MGVWPQVIHQPVPGRADRWLKRYTIKSNVDKAKLRNWEWESGGVGEGETGRREKGRGVSHSPTLPLSPVSPSPLLISGQRALTSVLQHDREAIWHNYDVLTVV